MSQTVSAFRQVPPQAQGLVRDIRVRWALEEAGERYQERMVTLGAEQTSPEYLKLQPFGQVPAYEENGLHLFESGAIVLHIAERSPELMPDNAQDRALVRAWLFAALNTVEVPITMMQVLDIEEVDHNMEVFRSVMEWIGTRLHQLEAQLGTSEYLVGGRFTAADLMMVAVLRQLRTTDMVAKMPTLDAYVKRGVARPAFRRALADQMRHFEASAPNVVG